ncbi:MAG: dockerin type I repeat-containing protein [Clostridia bacterium]|nr:dockerin type I repeat-containing protein [Clostridia bacterium]
MKKLFAVILTAAMLFTAFAAHAKTEADRSDSVHLEGYVIGDFYGNETSRWIGFDDSNPSEFESYSFSLSTFGAAYHDGYVYGYIYGYDEGGVLHDEYYSINVSNHIVNYVDGASSDGEFVYGMAYNYADDTMYALCNENAPYIASVDLKTGVLTKKTDINLGGLLGVQTLAIDGEGSFYLLSFSAVNSRLVKLDIESGNLSNVLETGMPCFYGQSMTWDSKTNRIYWAHVNERTSSTNGLYYFDLSSNDIVYCGMIGNGMEIMGLYSTSKYEAPDSYMLGDVNNDGSVDMSDALLALRATLGTAELDELASQAADIDGNSVVSMDDALSIIRYAMGLSDTLR